MQTFLKYLSQFLLIPLLKELVQWVAKQVKEEKEQRKVESENRVKGEAYENADASNAHDEFAKLP